jgi:hypothetical protein
MRFIPDVPLRRRHRGCRGIPGLLRGPVIPVATGADFMHFDVDREAARVEADKTARAWRQHLDESNHFRRPRRKAAVLSRPERSLVFAARHARLLREDGQGYRQRPGSFLEPHLLCSGHGPLSRRKRDAGPFRHVERRGGLGGEGRGSGPRGRHRRKRSPAAAVRCALIRSMPSTLGMAIPTMRSSFVCQE